MKRLFPAIMIAILAILSVTVYLRPGHILNSIDDLLAAAVAPAVDEPDPIILYEALDLPAEPGGEALPAVTDMRALALHITAGATTDYQRMFAVYDWITANFAYDLEKLADIEAFGAGAAYLLQTGRGICHDFADLGLALFTALEITATYESGDVFPVEGKTERHAWNHVKIDGTWYAMDTTWGAGFIVEEENRFIQKPRRLYLTTIEGLSRLHRDPAYREEQELAYRRTQAVQTDPVYLPGHEQELMERFNRFRAERNLPSLTEERALLEVARQAAARIAAGTAAGEDYTLEDLKREIEQLSSDLRIRKAGIFAKVQWTFEPPSAAQLYERIVQEQDEFLTDESCRAATVAVVRQGDITVGVYIYLLRH